MAEEVIRSQPLAEGVASYVSLDVGGDQLETSAAGFLLGDPEPECEQTIEQRMSSFLRRDGALIPVAELQEWDGVIAWRGRVVGVVAGLPHDRRLLSVTGTGELREEFNERVWSDNDECEAFGWALVQYPCGP